jgi:hypothetical protein
VIQVLGRLDRIAGWLHGNRVAVAGAQQIARNLKALGKASFDQLPEALFGELRSTTLSHQQELPHLYKAVPIRLKTVSRGIVAKTIGHPAAESFLVKRQRDYH